MSDPWKFNLHDLEQSIQRQLDERVSTRIFAGDQAMLLVAWIEPNSRLLQQPRLEGVGNRGTPENDP